MKHDWRNAKEDSPSEVRKIIVMDRLIASSRSIPGPRSLLWAWGSWRRRNRDIRRKPEGKSELGAVSRGQGMWTGGQEGLEWPRWRRDQKGFSHESLTKHCLHRHRIRTLGTSGQGTQDIGTGHSGYSGYPGHVGTLWATCSRATKHTVQAPSIPDIALWTSSPHGHPQKDNRNCRGGPAEASDRCPRE